jgi:hypothetical protein
MAVTEKISQLVENQFPDFYKEDGPNFIAFIEAYYEYMEQNGKMTDAVRNLTSYRDVSETTEEFLQYFLNTFVPSIPTEIVADKRLLIKYIKYFNQTRGTIAAYRLLFRALYNEDIEIFYPSDQILKVSDGDWRTERYLVTSYNPTTYTFIGKTIIGTESRSEALVEDIVRKTVRGRDLMQILLSNIKGNFNHLEPIRLLSDTAGTGHAPIAEAGISAVTVSTQGGFYEPGDIVAILSDFNGEFGKVVVTDTQDLNGIVIFDLVDGGSGFTSSTNGATLINFIGGDGLEEAGFEINIDDLVDFYDISLNTNLITANTIYGINAPVILQANGTSTKINNFASTPLSSPDFGFPEPSQQSDSVQFRDNVSAILNVNNSIALSVDAPLYGVSSGANAVITAVINSTLGNTYLRVDTYKRFSNGENITYGSTSGNTIGSVITFSANSFGFRILEVANLAGKSISVGDEIIGLVTGSRAIVQNVNSVDVGAYTPASGPNRDVLTLIITANTSSNLTSQFTIGPIKPFADQEGFSIVTDPSIQYGNVVSVMTTETSQKIENIYTTLGDSLLFNTQSVGTISRISLPTGGAGYSQAPTIEIREPNIAGLGIGEQYITLQSDDANWGTGNSSITALDTNDGLLQTISGASGDIKGGSSSRNPIPITSLFANGTYQTIVRVWQPFLQRKPDNITFTNDANVQINFHNSSYTPGTPDNRTPFATGAARIVNIEDEGVLGENAIINARVGANGAITGLRILDSGFGYRNNENVLIAPPNRNNGIAATATLSLSNVGNSEGYYATTRSQVSTKRGVIQDSDFYQEFSYEVISPLSFNRYRDFVLELVHPAGQALFGKYRTQSNVAVDVITASRNNKKLLANGIVILTTSSKNVVGASYVKTITVANSGTGFTNTDFITLANGTGSQANAQVTTTSNGSVSSLTINSRGAYTASPSTTNTTFSGGSGSGLNINITLSSPNLTAEYSNGDPIIIEYADKLYYRLPLNIVANNTFANLTLAFSGANSSVGVNAYYIDSLAG